MDRIRGDELTLPYFMAPRIGNGEDRSSPTSKLRGSASAMVQPSAGKNGGTVLTLSDGARNALRYAEQALEAARSFNRSDFAADLSQQLRDFLKQTYELLGMPSEKASAAADRASGASRASFNDYASTLPERARTQGFSMTELSISVQVETLDLKVETAQGSLALSFTSIQMSVSLTQVSSGQEVMQDPLAIDLDGNGIDTVDLDAGRRFDLNADGQAERTGWISGNDALLALDRNGNGVIDDGLELFGDAAGHADGLAALAVYDENQDGVIDADDPVFSQLQLLFADGRLKPLAEAGIARLEIGRPLYSDQAIAGGTSAARFQIGMQDGSARTGHDLWFRTTA